uniref:Uncharacterized protein n=1 Tax=Strigamia maritima TaxID=126957 RepID=T1IRN8_STRMM
MEVFKYPGSHMKAAVYATPVLSVEDLVACIVVAAGEVTDNPQIINRVRMTLFRRYQLCINAHGGHFKTIPKPCKLIVDCLDFCIWLKWSLTNLGYVTAKMYIQLNKRQIQINKILFQKSTSEFRYIIQVSIFEPDSPLFCFPSPFK